MSSTLQKQSSKMQIIGQDCQALAAANSMDPTIHHTTPLSVLKPVILPFELCLFFALPVPTYTYKTKWPQSIRSISPSLVGAVVLYDSPKAPSTIDLINSSFTIRRRWCRQKLPLAIASACCSKTISQAEPLLHLD